MKAIIRLHKITERPDGETLRVAYRKGRRLFIQSVSLLPEARFRVEHGEDGEVCIRFKVAEDEAVSIGVVSGFAEKKEIEGK